VPILRPRTGRRLGPLPGSPGKNSRLENGDPWTGSCPARTLDPQPCPSRRRAVTSGQDAPPVTSFSSHDTWDRDETDYYTSFEESWRLDELGDLDDTEGDDDDALDDGWAPAREE
jgi:hypothetical protein